MNYKFLVLFLFLNIISSSAQKLTSKAKLLTQDGEKTIAFVQNSFDKSYSSFFILEKGELTEINAVDVISISLPNNEKYIALEVDVIIDDSNKQRRKRKVFLKVIEEGDVSLYTYKNDFVHIASLGESPELLKMSRERYEFTDLGERILVDTDEAYSMKKDVGLFQIKKDYFHQIKKRIKKEIPIKSTVRLEGRSIRKVIVKHNEMVNNSTSYFTDNFNSKLSLGIKKYIKKEIPEDLGKFRLNLSFEISNPSVSKASSIIISYANKITESDEGVVMLGARRYFNQHNRFQPHVTAGFNTFGRESFLPYFEGGFHYILSRFSIYSSVSLIGPISPYGYEFGLSYMLN